MDRARRFSTNVMPLWMTRLEVQAVLVQCLLVTFFFVSVSDGIIEVTGMTGIIVACVAAYHVLLVLYVLLLRLRGRKLVVFEFLAPICDVLCITAAWVTVNDPRSPIWALYLYIIISTGRRVSAVALTGLTVFVLANLAGSIALTLPGTTTPVNGADFGIMSGITIAIAMLTHAIGRAWKGAETSALNLAHTDALTGLANRRAFTETLDAMLADPDAAVSVLMLDLDNFKQINDSFGHQEGDAVLLRAASLAAMSIREGDMLGRYGGEEFIIALPGVSAFEAEQIAERVRQRIHAGTPTSVSIGCAGRYFGEGADTLIQRADSLMFTAKRSGKNRVRTDDSRAA